MASWKCPHCGSPQAETSRCWVCRRSTTSCASCRHFRRSVAGRLNYCALDKHRTPMTGEEERACWEPAVVEVELEPGDAPAEGAKAAAAPATAGSGGLWGTPTAAEVPPDGEARIPGMWTESDSIRDPETPPHQHASSIRSRPWGPVPGLREPTGWRRGIRSVTRKG